MPKKNGNGEGSISYEAARKAYRAAITDPSGKRIIKRFPTKKEASDWLAKIRAEILNQSYITPSQITLGDWTTQYLELYAAPNVKRKTLLRYTQTAAHLADIASLPIQKITAHTIQTFYSKLDVSDSCRRKIHVLLKMLFKKAAMLEVVKKDIMLTVQAPKYAPKEVEIFTREEITIILSSIKNSKYYAKYYPIFLFAITTGARLGEILGLKINSVHKGYVQIENNLQDVQGVRYDETPKTRAGYRKVTISVELEKMLRHYPIGKVVDFNRYVFQTRLGTPMAPRNLERIWRNILNEAGIPYKKFHALRHTCATQLLAGNIPLLEVSKRLGHSDPSHTLKLYGHAIPGFDKTLPDKIDKIFSIAK